MKAGENNRSDNDMCQRNFTADFPILYALYHSFALIILITLCSSVLRTFQPLYFKIQSLWFCKHYQLFLSQKEVSFYSDSW